MKTFPILYGIINSIIYRVGVVSILNQSPLQIDHIVSNRSSILFEQTINKLYIKLPLTEDHRI